MNVFSIEKQKTRLHCSTQTNVSEKIQKTEKTMATGYECWDAVAYGDHTTT